MICIAEQYLRAGCGHGFRHHRLDGTASADRHKGRRFDRAVPGMQTTAARFALFFQNFEFQCHIFLSILLKIGFNMSSKTHKGKDFYIDNSLFAPIIGTTKTEGSRFYANAINGFEQRSARRFEKGRNDWHVQHRRLVPLRVAF